MLASFSDEVRELRVEGFSDARHRKERWVTTAALDCADVSQIEFRAEGKALLCHSLSKPQAAHISTDDCTPIPHRMQEA